MHSYLDHIYYVGFAFNAWHQIMGAVPKGAARSLEYNRCHKNFLLVYILTSIKSCQKAFILRDSRYPVSVRLLGPCVGVGLEVKN